MKSRRKPRATGPFKDSIQALLAEAGVQVDGPEPWDLRVTDERIYQRLIRDRELGLGESYQDGWFEVEALDEMLTRILSANLASKVTSSPKLMAIGATQVLRNNQTVSRASKNARAHYGQGNDLFSAMLDKRMIYSCAYWPRAEDLDTAQEAKLELICEKLGIVEGMRVLDIGCGWGGFAQFAASRYGAEVTGISPAIEQVTVARERCEGLSVDIRQADYRSISGRFDRIVSIGMMEHVGTKNLSGFFRRCDELLAPDGMMLHHTIGSNVSTNRSDPWFDKYIFPGGVLPSLGQIADAASRVWVIEDVHNFGPDYDRTLMAWYENIERAWESLPGYDDRFRRTWRYYLLGSAAGFRSRSTQLWQVVFRRAGRVSPRYDAPR